MNQGDVVGAIPQEVWIVIFCKAQKWHACSRTAPEATGYLVFVLSKLRF